MADKFEFLSAADKPALLAFSTPEWLEAARSALAELGYKVHTAATHGDFATRFSQIRYQVVIVEELFAANVLSENLTLQSLQIMPMTQRRHATVILFGDSFQTFSPLHAFQQSVHAVVNKADLSSLGSIIQKTTGDNDLFLHSYREVQAAAKQGKI